MQHQYQIKVKILAVNHFGYYDPKSIFSAKGISTLNQKQGLKTIEFYWMKIF